MKELFYMIIVWTFSGCSACHRKQTATTCDKFFLQADGNEFTKYSEAPGKLQDRYNLPNINNIMARKSSETFVQKCDSKQRTSMAEFLCHTEQVAGTHYAWFDKALEAYDLQVICSSTTGRGQSLQRTDCRQSTLLSTM